MELQNEFKSLSLITNRIVALQEGKSQTFRLQILLAAESMEFLQGVPDGWNDGWRYDDGSLNDDGHGFLLWVGGRVSVLTIQGAKNAPPKSTQSKSLAKMKNYCY